MAALKSGRTHSDVYIAQLTKTHNTANDVNNNINR